MSKNFERWKELAAQCLGEQDPAKLTELANEMNLVLTQKTQCLDPPLREPLACLQQLLPDSPSLGNDLRGTAEPAVFLRESLPAPNNPRQAKLRV